MLYGHLGLQDVSSSMSEGVVHIVESGLKSGQVSVRTCAVQGLLYLLQGPPEHSHPLVMLAANYILKYNDGYVHSYTVHSCTSLENYLWYTLILSIHRFSIDIAYNIYNVYGFL